MGIEVLLFKLPSSKITVHSFRLCWYPGKLPHAEAHSPVIRGGLLLTPSSPQRERQPCLDLAVTSAKEVHAGSSHRSREV